jgi:integrase/recombinase XerD
MPYNGRHQGRCDFVDFSSFSDFVDEFVKWLVDTGRRQRTIDEYVMTVLMFAAWFQQKYPSLALPTQVLSSHIIAFQQELLTQRKLSIATVHKYMASLKSFWDFLIEKNLAGTNPLLEIDWKTPSSPTVLPPHSWLDKEEEKRLLIQVEMEKNDWKRSRNRCLLLLMLDAGCTVSELIRMDWDQILWEDHEILVKNEQGKRRIPVTQRLYRALNDWRKEGGNKGTVVCTQSGAKMSRQGVHYLVKKYLKEIGLKEYSPHTLRHTFCRRLIEAGADLKTVCRLAGHQSMETTKRYLATNKK